MHHPSKLHSGDDQRNVADLQSLQMCMCRIAIGSVWVDGARHVIPVHAFNVLHHTHVIELGGNIKCVVQFSNYF